MYEVQIQRNEATAALRRVPVWLVDATDGITEEIDITGKPYMAKTGVSPAETTNSLVQVDSTNMLGLYYIELTAAEVDTLGLILMSFKTAATARWYGSAQVVDYDPYGLKAEINAEMVDALNVDTYPEPGQDAPPATASIVEKINRLYKQWRNKSDNDGTTSNLYADDNTTVDQKRGVTEAAGTVTKDKIATGP